jgi:hypothetical protein
MTTHSAGVDSRRSGESEPSIMSTRQAFILFVSTVSAVVGGAGTLRMADDPYLALVATGGGFAKTYTFLNKHIGP